MLAKEIEKIEYKEYFIFLALHHITNVLKVNLRNKGISGFWELTVFLNKDNRTELGGFYYTSKLTSHYFLANPVPCFGPFSVFYLCNSQNMNFIT